MPARVPAACPRDNETPTRCDLPDSASRRPGLGLVAEWVPVSLAVVLSLGLHHHRARHHRRGMLISSGSSASGSTTAKPAATPMSGTETFTGTLTGAAAAEWLNSNSNAAPSLASLVFTDPVDTTISGPVSLGKGNAKTATHTFVTPAGSFTVGHTAKTKGQTQPTVTGTSGSTCYFTLNAGAGSYAVPRSKSTLDLVLLRETYLEACTAAVLAGRLTSGADVAEVLRAARLTPAPSAPPGAPDLLLDTAGRGGPRRGHAATRDELGWLGWRHELSGGWLKTQRRRQSDQRSGHW
jgi:hypothetical protein